MSRTLLIAETNASVREMLAHILTLRGFEVLQAADGPEALALARGAKLAGAVLDLHLPGLSGFAVCRALRNEQATLPVWITSGGCHPATLVRARAAGALLVVRKPFRPTDICRRIEREVLRHGAGSTSMQCV